MFCSSFNFAGSAILVDPDRNLISQNVIVLVQQQAYQLNDSN